MRKLLCLTVIPALLVLGACSNDDAPSAEEDPTAVLLAAFEETGESEAQTVTISLVSTPESLVAASEGEVTPEQADTILGSSLSVSATKSEDPAESKARFALDVPGTEGAELIVLGQDLYARADVAGFAGLAGSDMASLDRFARQAESAGATFIRPLLDGEFVKFEGLQDAAGELGGASPPSTEQTDQIVDQLREAIRESSTVTSEGSDDVGEHLVANIRVRDLYSRFQQLLPQLGVPVFPGSVPDASEVPDEEFRLDAWISDGKLVQLEVDLLQVATIAGEEPPEGVDEAAVRIALSDEAEELSAPEAATTVTAQEVSALISGLIFGGGFGGGDLPSDAQVTAPPGDAPGDEPGDAPGDAGDFGIDCSIYEGLPPETFKGLPKKTLQQLEQICPGIVPD